MKQLWNWFRRRKLDIIDTLLIILLVAGSAYSYKHIDKYDLSFDKDLPISNPWMATTDNAGNTFVVDSGRARIVVIDENHQVSRTITSDASEADTFYYPDSIAVSEKGGLYVQDSLWSSTGFSLDGEHIMYYSPEGAFDHYVYQVNYEDIYCDKHRIFALTEYQDTVYFVTADEKGFILNSVPPSGGEATQIAAYPLDEAITLIQDFALEPASQTIYAVDKRGMLLKAENGSLTQVQDVYRNAAADQQIALYRSAVDAKGNVYVTDIASNRLLYFEKANDYQVSELASGAGIWTVAVNRYSGHISLVKDEHISVLDASGNTVLEGTEFKKSNAFLKGEGFFDIAALLAALGALYLLLRLFALVVSIKYSAVQRTGVLIAFSVLIVTAIILGQLTGDFKVTYRDEIINRLEMSAQIVSHTTDIEALKAIKNSQDYMNEDYKKLLSSINTTVNKKFENCQDMYCNILRCEGEEVYAIAYIDNSIGAYFPLFDDEAREAQKVYETGETLRSDTVGQAGSYIYVKSPIPDSDGQVIGVVEIGTDSNVLNATVNNMLRKIAIPLIMMILVILFAFSEIFSFFDLRSKYQDAVQVNKPAVPLHVVRFLVFATFMAFNLATSFLPVYILKFAAGDMGISRELAASIPMSINLLFIALTSLICTKLLSSWGFKRVAVCAAGIAFAGDLTLALAQNYLMIVLGLALNGIGVGIIINAIHIFMASSRFGEDRDRGYGLSIFSAASLSGINCGMMFGAAIAENLQQSDVFMVATAAWLVIMLIFLLLGKGINIASHNGRENGLGSMTLRQFIFNKNVLSFMLLIQIPYIALSSFTYYYVPIFAEVQGLGENESCMLIMISSLCSVYLSIALTEYLGNKIKHNTLYLSSLITYIALILFAFNMSIPMLIVTMVMIGIANSFGTTSRVQYFTSSEEAVVYGQDRSMGIYNFVDNAGESAGPILLASIISSGFFMGMIKLIAVFTGMNGLFALGRRLGKKTSENMAAKM